MSTLIEIRQSIMAFYIKHYNILSYVSSGLVTFLLLLIINIQLGLTNGTMDYIVIFAISIISSFLNSRITILFASFYYIYHIAQVFVPLSIGLGIIILLGIIIYYHLSIGNDIFLILTTICLYLRIPYVLPIVFGLKGGPTDIISLIMGSLFYLLLSNSRDIILPIISMGNKDVIKVYNTLYEHMLSLSNKNDILIFLCVGSIGLLIVYIIKRLDIKYSHSVAIATGNIFMFISFLILYYKYNSSIEILVLGLSFGICILIEIIYSFLVYNFNYGSIENLQFEDDEYLYMVKAIPKTNIAKKDLQIHRITDKQKKYFDTEDINAEK